MDNNIKTETRPSIHSLRGWLNTSLGLILMIFALIGAFGKTVVGSFLVYSLAFLFGMFYPFALALLFVYGLYLAVTRHAFPLKGKFLGLLGFSLLIIGTLAFGSYGIFSMKESGVDFISLNSVYLDRMDSFARSFYQIDSLESLSGLGGGYLGLFFLTLLGSVWGKIGNAIFYSLILIAGVFFITFRPTLFIIRTIREEKKKHVSYSSPYQPKKDKSNPHLEREMNFKTEMPEETKETSQPVQENAYIPSKNAQAPLKNTWSNDDQGSFGPFEAYEVKPETMKEETFENNITPVDNEDFHRATVTDVPAFQKQEDSDFETISPTKTEEKPEETKPVEVPDVFSPVEKKEEATMANQNKPPFVPDDSFVPMKAKPVDVEMENPFASAYSHDKEKEETISKEAKDFSDASKIDSNTMPIREERINPLERVNASAPIKENHPAEYRVEGINSPVQNPVEPIVKEEVESVPLTEEEIEKQKEQAYFAHKQKKQAEALLAKKREKEERLSSLMQYVSDVPKDYHYDLPNDALLEEIDDSAKMEKNSSSAQEKALIINRVFDEFAVKAKATSFTIGASVTRFNVETEHGEKADKIANLTSEFQRALNGDMSVRVETVVEGRSTSGIEVGNIAPMAVSFKDMFSAIENDHKNLLLLPIGKDISGNVVTFPLNKMPHMLVAGTTGSGKSVLIHSMIMTLIMRTYPSQCKLMLIDPKQVEFIRYQDCSHLFCPVISKPESAILALKKLCEEMDRRFTVLSKCKCANLEDYEAIRAGRESQYEEMPYIVTVIDEFADLMQTGGNEVTKYVTRIAQKARACGIHLIIATQRPSKDNVPMIIKANVPCRIGLSCSSQIDSRVILDETGAETLLGKGDLLFKCPGKKSLIRAQSPFISNADINKVLEYVKKNAGNPNYDPEFLDLEVPSQDEEEADVEGDLYSDIKEYVIYTGITSKSSIMRSFQVSSMKADQFLARLQSESIIAMGPSGKFVLGPAAHLEDYEA